MIAMNDCELYEHLSGDAMKPTPAIAAQPTKDETKALKNWQTNENKAMSFLVS